MQPASVRPWSGSSGIGLLAVASPLLLATAWFVLVGWPWDAGVGIVAALFNQDVIQTANAEETGVSVLLLCIAVWAVCWLRRIRLPERYRCATRERPTRGKRE